MIQGSCFQSDKGFVKVLGVLLAIGLTSVLAQAQSYTGVLTWHNDNQRTGQNLTETVLTPSKVNSENFGKLFSFPVDGQIYAQPLYVHNVTIPNQGVHNVVYVATENDSVYAIDADNPSSTPLWHDSFLSAGVTAVPCKAAPGTCPSISPTFGITGTPVIDGTTGTLYVVALTAEKKTYVQRLHALDIATGAEKFGGPVVIQASITGSGQGSASGVIKFSAIHEIQRSALLLSNGTVYIAWAGFGYVPWHGWILGYNAKTLAQVAVFNDTPDGERGGIWSSGSGIAADTAGNLYVMTGDGTFDADGGGRDYGDSFLKLSPSGSNGLTVLDYFTPFNQDSLSDSDLDVGSGGPLILPPQKGSHPDEIVGAGKEAMIFLVDRDIMGKYSPSENTNIQTVSSPSHGFWSSAAYWRNAVYYAGTGKSGFLSRYPLSGGLLSTTPASQSAVGFGFPGATPSVSANGETFGIVWAIQNKSGQASGGPSGILRAFAAADVATLLYSSSQMPDRDAPGPATKFAVPTIVNGKVYVGTQTELDVYGLLEAEATK